MSETVRFNYAKLRGRIIEILGTQGRFASEMGLTPAMVSETLKNRRRFTQQEILKAMEILQIPDDEMKAYFFAPEDVKSRTPAGDGR